MKLKATVLCENCVFNKGGAVAEHGWGIFLETDEGNFLFDTGQGLGLVNNARVFKKDLSTLKGIIISHQHMDHTGGLYSALSVTGPIDVYAHPELFKESYYARMGMHHYIGIPFSKTALEDRGAHFKYNTDFTEIVHGMYLTGEIPRLTDFELGDDDVVIKTENGFVKDPILDDQSVVVETEKGLLIILGCSHSGIVNIINHAIKQTGQDRIYAIVGGTHLGPANEEQQEKTIHAFKEFNIERIGVSHCTGLEVSMRLLQEFKERFFFCNVGTVIEV